MAPEVSQLVNDYALSETGDNRVVEIAVAGKGGSGKTAIAGTLARVLAARGERVLAIDAATNPNLGLSVGLKRDFLHTIRQLPNTLLQRAIDDAGKPRPVLTMSLDEVTQQYGTSVAGVDLRSGQRRSRSGSQTAGRLR